MSEKKIIYNGQEYANTVMNSQGVGEFTSNSGVKEPTGSNSEIFNNYYNNIATGEDSHAEGYGTKALGNYSHVEGYSNYSNVLASHTEGYGNDLSSTYILNEGIDYSKLKDDINAAVSSGIALPTGGTIDIFQSCVGVHNEGQGNLVSGNGAHVEGVHNGGFGTGVHIEGQENIGGGFNIHIEGFFNKNVTYSNDDTNFENPIYIWDRTEHNQMFAAEAHIEGAYNLNSGECSHTEGDHNKNYLSNRAHIEGYGNTLVYAHDTHVEGINHTVTGTAVSNLGNLHIEGVNHTIETNTSITHVEGENNYAAQATMNSHIEGTNNSSAGGAILNHIEGTKNTATDGASICHIEGDHNKAQNGVKGAHISGCGNISTTNYQTVIGKYANATTEAFVIGNGTTITNTRNKYINYPGVTYAVGDEVMYEGQAYKCITAITEPEDFDSTKWQLLDIEIIGDQEVTSRINSFSVSWDGITNAQSDVQIRGNSIIENFAPAYDNTISYPANSFCTYLGKLYTNPSAITTAEDFNNSHWNETTFATIQTNNNSGMSSLGAGLTSVWQSLGPLVGSTGKVAVLETNVSNHETRITALEQGGGSSTVDAIVINSSDEYNTSATYNVGDYCIYNNILYKCTTAVTAETTFDSNKWEATTIISVLNVLNQRLTALEALPNLDNEPL